MTPLICVSASAEQATRLQNNGPRRDFMALAEMVNGEVLFATDTRSKGLKGRLTGPHLRQAWTASRRGGGGRVLFADGEHIGIPLLGFLALSGRRNTRVVMLGHLVSRRWKRALLAITSRLITGGVLVVHSEVQAATARKALGKTWTVQLVPYQVDTRFWESSGPVRENGPILAVGSENRDYETLAEAARGMNRPVLIAAGSHWARSLAGSSSLPSNVEYRSTALSFSELRDEYDAASLVVMPLKDVDNQSGVTGILEAMSMARPVVVTASRGQRECVTGPLIQGNGLIDALAASDRGPQLFGDAPDDAATGVYASPDDPSSLRAAIEYALADINRAREIGTTGRRSAERHFSFERYVTTLADLLREANQPVQQGSLSVAEPR